MVLNMVSKSKRDLGLRGACLLACFAAVLASGCGKKDKPGMVYMPDMAYSPAIKAQEHGSSRMPVKGTVPRGHQSYAFAKATDGPGAELKNPLLRTKDVLARGQELFNTYCMVCHGPVGLGDGSVVPKMPRPPSLQSDKIKNWPDSNIFHVMTVGQNIMPSYAAQIQASDRWAIVHYIRALQRSQNPSAADMAAAEVK
jgi:mono/diheme cytochrome c family protein